MTIKESLNILDTKAIDNNEKFLDLRNLYEAANLDYEKKKKLKELIDKNEDPEVIAAYMVDNSDDENLKESILFEDDLHDVFRKDVKNQYKRFSSKLDAYNEKAKDYSELLKDFPDINDKETVKILLGDEPKFKLDKGYNHLERQNFPYYITHYEGTSFYHPEEGGYYVGGLEPDWSEGFESFEEAVSALRDYLEENNSVRVSFNPRNVSMMDDNYAYEDSTEDYEEIKDNKGNVIGAVARGKYIGEEDQIWVESNKEYLSRQSGDRMYESLKVTEAKNPVTLFCEYEIYERYNSSARKKKIKASGKDHLEAIKKIVDKMMLYIDSDRIDEDNYTFDEVIDNIKFSNGDGCDFIIKLYDNNGNTFIEDDFEEDDDFEDLDESSSTDYLSESLNEALSDEAKANNEMIQKILNKKPSQLTAKEKKFLTDNDLVRAKVGSTPTIGKSGSGLNARIYKGVDFINHRNSYSERPYADRNINDVDQLNLLKKRKDKSDKLMNHINAKDELDILEPITTRGDSLLQDFNQTYQYNIKKSNEYADAAKRDLDSYAKTGDREHANSAQHYADVSRMFRRHAKDSLEYRPKFESLNEDTQDEVSNLKYKLRQYERTYGKSHPQCKKIRKEIDNLIKSSWKNDAESKGRKLLTTNKVSSDIKKISGLNPVKIYNYRAYGSYQVQPLIPGFQNTFIISFWKDQDKINMIVDELNNLGYKIIDTGKDFIEVEKDIEINKSLTEDTIKTKSGKWVNKGKEGTHGKFKTKKEADAQRKAMFASGYRESFDEAKIVEPKYGDGDVVFIGDASGYQGTFLIEGDFRNIPEELYSNIRQIKKYGNTDDHFYLVEYNINSKHLFEEDYKKFFDYITPLLNTAGISIVDIDELAKRFK